MVRGLGLDRHPELLPVYFAGYRRVVYLSQHDDPALLAMAQRAAVRLGLAFEHRHTGYGELGSAMARLAADGGERPTAGRRRTARRVAIAGRRERRRVDPRPRRPPDWRPSRVISWRDIPAQVIARRAAGRRRRCCRLRFQVAIDRRRPTPARRTWTRYLAEWRRTARPCGEDLDAEVAAEVARIEAAVPRGAPRRAHRQPRVRGRGHP